MEYLNTSSPHVKDTSVFCCLLFLTISGSYGNNIGQVTHETNYLVVIQVWGLQTKSGYYTDTVQIRLKPGDLITWKV